MIRVLLSSLLLTFIPCLVRCCAPAQAMRKLIQGDYREEWQRRAEEEAAYQFFGESIAEDELTAGEKEMMNRADSMCDPVLKINLFFFLSTSSFILHKSYSCWFFILS